MADAATNAGTMQEEDSPAFVSPAYEAMEDRWKLCRDMMEGTEAVRREANLDTYFPKGDAETTTERLARAYRAELYPMFAETVDGLTGLVLRDDPELGDDVPAPIRDLWENIDGAGSHGAVFASNFLTEGMSKGHAGILIDVARVSTTRRLTIAEEKALGLRPYWVLIRPEQIINWRTAVISGEVVLTLLVIEETIDQPLGLFGTTSVTQFRVFRRELGTGRILFELWTQAAEDKEPTMTQSGEIRGQRSIPFVAFYAGPRLAALQSVPPLLDLAYTNVAHVQVLSDYRSSLHAAGHPILVLKGLTRPNRPDVNSPEYLRTLPGQTEDNPALAGANVGDTPVIVSGVNIGIEVDKDGDVTYAEHQGHAIGGMRQELVDIQTRAASQGMAMLQRDTRAAQTAEAEKLQRSEKTASLKKAARSFQDALEAALAYTAAYLGLPDGGSIVLNGDFEKIELDTPRIQALSALRANGDITRRTLWKMIADVMPDDFNPDDEQNELEGETRINLRNPAPGTPPGGAPSDGGAPPE